MSLTLCPLGNFSRLLSSDLFKFNFFEKTSVCQTEYFVGPDLGPNCLQMLSADDTRR